jgi:hypothetical protein
MWFGYSRLVARDESGTFVRLRQNRPDRKVKPVTNKYWSDDALPEKPTITSISR